VKKTIHSDAQQALCATLVAERKRAGLTQSALARRLKRPQSFVAKVENGERRLDVVEFIRYAQALAVNPAKLLRKLHRDRCLWD
jgi:transcriptional regulator with XRE-family HTH domain